MYRKLQSLHVNMLQYNQCCQSFVIGITSLKMLEVVNKPGAIHEGTMCDQKDSYIHNKN